MNTDERRCMGMGTSDGGGCVAELARVREVGSSADVDRSAHFARRTFSLATWLCLVLCVYCQSTLAAEVTIVVDQPLTPIVRRALDELTQAITQRGHTTQTAATFDAEQDSQVVVGIAGKSAAVDKLIKSLTIALAPAPESLAIFPLSPARQQYLIAGRDERGLAYALRDAARAVQTTPPETREWSSFITSAVESPLLKVRNVSIHLFNADCEYGWYFDDKFWHDYLRQLSLSRFNWLTLTFCDQTNYLCPLYAYTVEMPEYPQVQVENGTSGRRALNRMQIRRISEIAAEYGVNVQLGIWMQAPVARWSAPVRVTGLPEGLEHARYCALGLQRLLTACPLVRGVQLRMNAEAGVNEEQQTEFYRPMFRALRELNRPMRLELRYKGLQASTIQAARDEQLDVTVSTKYWAEHFGLPYHPTSVDSHWREDRYSFGALLRQPRSYRVTYQLWTAGSQRISLWGDPDYARRFAESCTLGGGEGFEVFAPLTNQGYGDAPGAWDVIADAKYRVGRWPQDRYWYFYLCFGRLGYNPNTNSDVWRREFRQRFGKSADEIEAAYATASQILPLITAYRLPGASEWGWWPELDTGGGIREYARIQPSDPRQFYAIRSWQKTERWRWEEWDETPGFVEEFLDNKLRGKWNPLQVATALDKLSGRYDLFSNRSRTPNQPERSTDSPELKYTLAEFAWLKELASFHVQRIRAAVAWSFYEATGDRAQLALAIKNGSRSVASWNKISELNKHYHQALVFGISADSPRSKLGHSHTGHWRDRLAELTAELADLEQERAHPQILVTKEIDTMRLNSFGVQDRGESRSRVRQEQRIHKPPQFAIRGESLTLTIEPPWSHFAYKRVLLHHRPLDQTRDWRELEMQSVGKGVWTATIPAEQIDPEFELQYYFELLNESGGTLWPSWTERQPYFVVPVR